MSFVTYVQAVKMSVYSMMITERQMMFSHNEHARVAPIVSYFMTVSYGTHACDNHVTITYVIASQGAGKQFTCVGLRPKYSLYTRPPIGYFT